MTAKELDELERLKEPQNAMLSLITDLDEDDTDLASAVTRRFQWYEERAVELIQAAARERDALAEQLEYVTADRNELRSVFGAAQQYYYAVYGRPPSISLEDAENAVLKAVEGYLQALAQHRGEEDRGRDR
jgi:DNA repair exonuclease SbcCD ATPase subunit